ncbi:TetR/AcrR family transcriptional regulator [Salegentibacter sp. F188]|uniref:TetR/AcrR family transcriptional regulator n=1 Tax=Autumnicola patrickiae TaxID=3075591 RepID=A0ABU3E6W7_9FLAO|nr:TetR/AcrR family transcriptional regulator [Salegentibacter sp. F188]MDT0691675.1 TetR/AcrR family transcriptional regulator [Salegentibacter sp. F188]
MREKILSTASDMFLSLGFKSVTMDDIADKLGISKKTIYTHFSTKNKLVQATIVHLFEVIQTGINDIRAQKKNPIIELYEIKRFAMRYLKDEKASPHYQLNKYYPKIAQNIEKKNFNIVQECVTDNLERGIISGHYRTGIPVSFIGRIHYLGMAGIKDSDVFPPEEYSKPKLMEYFLDYHLHAICTSKGLKILEEFKKDHENFN